MSRRTTPLLGAPASSSSFPPAAREPTFYPTAGMFQGSTSAENLELKGSLFQAVLAGRFDNLRRIVQAEGRNILAERKDENGRNALEVALNRALEVDSELRHCTRNGTIVASIDVGEARRIRACLILIIEYIIRESSNLSTANEMYIPNNALHMAASADLFRVVSALILHHPHLVHERDVRRRIPVHLVFGLAPRTTATNLLKYLRLMSVCDLNKRDIAGRTPLHYLIKSLVDSRGSSLGNRFFRRAPLWSLASVIEWALLHGADILVPDNKGSTVLMEAIKGNLDYLALIRIPDFLHRKITHPRESLALLLQQGTGAVEQSNFGDFYKLPKDVVFRIMTHVSPRDAVKLGETCKAAYHLVHEEFIWRHLSSPHIMAHLNLELRRENRQAFANEI